MNNKEILQNLKKYNIGQISRTDIINLSANYLKNPVEDSSLRNILELITQSSVINNHNYNQIEEIRCKLWPYLANIKIEIEEPNEYLYKNIRHLKFEDPNTFKQEYTQNLNFLIKEYLNDGMSEQYFIELVNLISFTNNYTKIVVLEFSDLNHTIIEIVDYSYYYIAAQDSPRKAPWNLEEELNTYISSLMR